MKGSFSIKRTEIWRSILILLWVLSIIKADDAIRNRHDLGSKRDDEESSIHTAGILTLDMVKERMDRQQNIFDRIGERMEDVPAVEHSRSRADGRRCAQEDIECRHFTAALEKDIETQTLNPTPIPTPAPTDRPNVPTVSPTLSQVPTSSPTRTLRPSRSPSHQPSSRPSTSPSTTPSSAPSASPTSVPTQAPSAVCSVTDRATGIYGDDTGLNYSVTVDYFYEVELNNATTIRRNPDLANATIVEDEILPSIGILVADTIVPRIFTRECASFLPPSLRNGLRRRRLEAVGVSAVPRDFIVNGVDCVNSNVNETLNVCYVVRGASTLFFPFLTNITEVTNTTNFTNTELANLDDVETTLSQARVAVREAITRGYYDDAHPNVVAIYYRASIPPQARGSIDTADSSVPFWAWIIVALAIIFCNICILMLWNRRRQSDQQKVGALPEDDDEGDKEFFNNNNNGDVPMPFNDLDDQSEEGKPEDFFAQSAAVAPVAQNKPQFQEDSDSDSSGVYGSDSESEDEEANTAAAKPQAKGKPADDSDSDSDDTNELLQSSSEEESEEESSEEESESEYESESESESESDEEPPPKKGARKR